MKKILICFIIISSLFASRLMALTSDTLRLYYDININTLNSSQFAQIDSFLTTNNQQEIAAINIIAYADFLATDAYNKVLSQQRADNVKKYISAKLDSKLIHQCIGKGELPPELTNQPLGIAENRRVEIILHYVPKPIAKSKTKALSDANEGEHIVLNNMNFQPGRHFLTSASQPELETLLNTLTENPRLEIKIEGHICCEFVGKDGYDQDTYSWDLSLHRAKYIYDYLIKNKIAPERLQYSGYGSSKPLVYPEKNTDDENINRRVEIVIVKK